jgi:hypothetical protein
MVEMGLALCRTPFSSAKNTLSKSPEKCLLNVGKRATSALLVCQIRKSVDEREITQDLRSIVASIC